MARDLFHFLSQGSRRWNGGGTFDLKKYGEGATKMAKIIGIVEKVMEREGRMAFCEVSRINCDLFRLTGLAKYVRSFETEKEALDYLAGNA